MPYDICEDEATLDYIENEMARRGVTQQLIDETRAHTEMQMLADLQQLAADGGNLDMHDSQGATPVRIFAIDILSLCFYCLCICFSYILPLRMVILVL